MASARTIIPGSGRPQSLLSARVAEGGRLLKITDLARRLNVGRTTVYELIWRGDITPIHIGRSVRFESAASLYGESSTTSILTGPFTEKPEVRVMGLRRPAHTVLPGSLGPLGGSTASRLLTLISVAWMLTLFERAVEQGHPHPGFLMIDSPQKNLRPTDDQVTDEFRDPAIAERVWGHILRWSGGAGRDYQLIIVDNAPSRDAEPAVVVQYSGRAESPPYGLIDDETE